jgi:hypothetical protein
LSDFDVAGFLKRLCLTSDRQEARLPLCRCALISLLLSKRKACVFPEWLVFEGISVDESSRQHNHLSAAAFYSSLMLLLLLLLLLPMSRVAGV